MSKWNHLLCRFCYRQLEPGRKPVTLKEAEVDSCCRCTKDTSSGIYYRKDPETIYCRGVSGVHKKELD